jgi:hypothetical protein
MSPALVVQIVVGAAIVIGLLMDSRQARRVQKASKQTFDALGAQWSLGLGTCLSGLPSLEAPAPVTCGGTAYELLFLADADQREICRIPWSAIQEIFGGDETETRFHLRALDGLPSLILGQSDPPRNDRKSAAPSYLVIDWTGGDSVRRQAVFEQRSPGLGKLKAKTLELRKMALGVPTR